MKPAWLLPLLLLAADGAMPKPTSAPSWADRLAWNARERTARGLAELEAGEPATAVPAFDAALRLRPDDSLARFNAGTARLEAQDPEAASLLEGAARAATGALAPAAWYNAGNARLAAGDAAGAVEAYREALRRASAHLPSKHNLEIALRELEKQRQQQEQEQQRQEEQREEQQQQQQEQQQEDEQGQEQQPPEPQPQSQDQQEEPREDRSSKRPLPQFRDQEDMTAEQAEALLQAVEDLERQQRRERALEQARQRTKVEKDW